MPNLKMLPIIMVLMFTGLIVKSQSIKFQTFGSDSTLEVMTWNLEQFPKEGQTTIEYVSNIITALKVDVIALQEMSNQSEFDQVLSNLEGYSGFITSGGYTNLAYIYNSGTIGINQIYEIYTSSTYSSPFPRPPLVFDFNYKNLNFIVISNHLKCCGDGVLDIDDPGDEETRRYRANLLLRQYINEYFPDKRVFIVGDMNDEITDDVENNVFQIILNDTQNYLFADMEIANGNSANWSYPSWPSHLDHIVITNELFPAFENEGSEIQVLKVEELISGGWWNYENNVSDHRPVAIKLLLPADLGIEAPNTSGGSLTCYPNPFTDATTFSYPSFTGTAQIQIWNNHGKTVYSEVLTGMQNSFYWSAAELPEGIYFARMVVNGRETAATKLIVAR